LDYLPVGVIILKKDNRIKLLNKEINQLICINQGENSPRHAATKEAFTQMIEQAEPKRSLKQILEEKQEFSDESEKVYRMGFEGKSFEIKTKHLSADSAKSCKIAIIKDQTVYETLIKEKMMEKYQRMLLSSISHEIRNPLNAIEGYLTILKETEVTKENLTNYCSKLQSASHQIAFIVDGACDLLLCGNKTLILQPRRFDIRKCIDEVTEILMPNIEVKGIQLIRKVTGVLPKQISSDSKRYQLVLFQLLANAVKYTTKGEICIDCSFDSINNMIITKISDTGSGISPEVLPNLFKLYSNIEKANAYNPQGMGLGLALCEKLSKILGGEISCTSVLNQGSEFTFTIKNISKAEKTSVHDPELYIPLSGIEGDELQNVKLYFPNIGIDIQNTTPRATDSSLVKCECNDVLLVDDEATNRMVLKHYLKTINVYADEASDGLEGYNEVEERSKSECCSRYKLIVMDINMPVMDGTEATKKLIELFEKVPKAKAPIIAVTAANLQTRDDIQNLLAVGFSEICIFVNIL